MGNRRMKHLRELQARAMAGDKFAKKSLEAELFVPHHLRKGTRQDRLIRQIGTKFKQGVHVTAKTHKAIRCLVSTTVSADYGLDRLQMLKDRRQTA